MAIFDKYKKKCNPKNKNLLFISDKCKFDDPRLHGGFECDDDGFWSKKCIPSYCDNGYVYDKKIKKCIKDICIIPFEKNKYEHDNNLSKIPILIISLFIIIEMGFVICIFKNLKRNKKDLFIIFIVINFIFLVIFYFYIL